MSVQLSLQQPDALRPGDRVRVLSPAGPVIPELLDQGLSTLQNWGLEVLVDHQTYHRRPPYDYLAGDDRSRLHALTRALDDPHCKAIICSRGGYGAMRSLPQLSPERWRANRPLLVGFSDITALHLFLSSRAGLTSLHGPVVKSFGLHDSDPHQSLRHLRDALFGRTSAPAPFENLCTIRGGRVTGPVYGGTLSLLVALLATPYCPDLSGAVLILEDVGEADYRLDRLLTSLRLATEANDSPLGAIVLGDFLNCEGVYVESGQLSDFVATLADDFQCPVVANAPVSHGSSNRCFPMGVTATLDGDEGTLRFHSHAVKAPIS